MMSNSVEMKKRNSNMPFLRNELSKIFEDLHKIFTMALFWFTIKQIDCKIISRKFLKLKRIDKFLPTAWSLNYKIFLVFVILGLKWLPRRRKKFQNRITWPCGRKNRKIRILTLNRDPGKIDPTLRRLRSLGPPSAAAERPQATSRLDQSGAPKFSQS